MFGGKKQIAVAFGNSGREGERILARMYSTKYYYCALGLVDR